MLKYWRETWQTNGRIQPDWFILGSSRNNSWYKKQPNSSTSNNLEDSGQTWGTKWRSLSVLKVVNFLYQKLLLGLFAVYYEKNFPYSRHDSNWSLKQTEDLEKHFVCFIENVLWKIDVGVYGYQKGITNKGKELRKSISKEKSVIKVRLRYFLLGNIVCVVVDAQSSEDHCFGRQHSPRADNKCSW